MSALDAIQRFFSSDAGQRRREGLASLESRAQEALRYYLGPTGIPDRINAANQVLNPISHLEQARGDARRAMDPELPPRQRAVAGASAALGAASTLMPAVAAARRMMTPTQALMETFGLRSLATPSQAEDLSALLEYNARTRVPQGLLDRNVVPQSAGRILLRPDRNYRYIGDSGYADFLESGVIRARQGTRQDYGDAYFMVGRPSGRYAGGGGDRYMVEAPGGADWRVDPAGSYARPPRHLTRDDPIRIFELGPDGQYRVVLDNIGDTPFLP